MINLFDYINPENYQVIIENGTSKIYHVENAMINQEKFISVMDEAEQTVIFIHNRDEIKRIASFRNKTDALGLAIILCHKYFETINHSEFEMDELREASSQHDIEEITKIISNDCLGRYFSIFGFKDNAICMVKNEKSFDVYLTYGNVNKEILKEASLFRASIITRNYAKLLEKFYEIYQKISGELSSTSELRQVYLEHYLF